MLGEEECGTHLPALGCDSVAVGVGDFRDKTVGSQQAESIAGLAGSCALGACVALLLGKELGGEVFVAKAGEEVLGTVDGSE